MDSSSKFPLIDVIAAINTAIGRNEFSPAPVCIEDLINHITAISRRFSFKFNEEMINVLQFCQENSMICLRGLFGYCDPLTCPDCQSFKKEQLPRLWEIWIKQHKPEVMDEPLRLIPKDMSESKTDEIITTDEKTIKCKFGMECTNKKCPFLHPKLVKCRFGVDCTRENCYFWHPKPLKETKEKPEISPPRKCRYGAECKKIGCTFIHPKKSVKVEKNKCKFGAACTKEGCTFFHPEKSEKSKKSEKSESFGFLQVPFSKMSIMESESSDTHAPKKSIGKTKSFKKSSK